MLTSDFDYSLPENLIAQHPNPTRSTSRLLVLDRTHRTTHLTSISNLPTLLRPGDLLVLNNSKVIPARLRGHKVEGGGRIEILLLEPADTAGWWTLLRPGKRVRPGSRVHFTPRSPSEPVLEGVVAEKNAEGHCRIEFPVGTDVIDFACRNGEMPLPPYIRRPSPEPGDSERYQTVYAREPGSAAAPTAGLHFDAGLLEQLRAHGIETCEVTLHVGVGTFAPVKTDRPEEHSMHSERYEVSPQTAEKVNATRKAGGRVIAVGTTSLRTLESVARQHHGLLAPGPGRTRLFIHPPADFLITDGLLTNFHLPRSTLLMLVSAFAAPGSESGRDLVLSAYRQAVAAEFRFFSYGDAMLLL